MKVYVEPSHNDLCWACRMQSRPKYMSDWQWVPRIYMYEELLEAAESLGTFTIREVMEQKWVSPENFGLVRHLIADLKLHGLVEQAGNKSSAKVWKLRE